MASMSSQLYQTAAMHGSSYSIGLYCSGGGGPSCGLSPECLIAGGALFTRGMEEVEALFKRGMDALSSWISNLW